MKSHLHQWILVAVTLLGMLPVSAYDFQVDGIYYNINGEEVTVTNETGGRESNSYSGEVVIPSSVTYEGKEYSVTSIGEYAFQNCSQVTSVMIPETVMSIGLTAFNSCTGLESIAVSDKNPLYSSVDGVLYNKDITILRICPGGRISMVIPSSVTTIGESAFYGCAALTSVSMSDSVVDIEDFAFTNCVNLNSIEIPSSVTNIGNYSFANCENLVSIEIPESVIIIGELTFFNCTNLTSVEIPKSVITIGNSAFSNCTSLASVEIPSLVTTIGKSAFSKCTSLASVEIPPLVTTIGKLAFEGCTGLTSVKIPSSVTTIEESTFEGCTGLTSVEIPSSVTSIGKLAFGLTGLTSIEIPSSVTTIGESVFNRCANLTSVKIPSSVTTIGKSAFEGTAWYDNQPDGVVYINRVLYKYKGTMPENTHIDIKEETVSITGTAFQNCRGLVSVTVPNSVMFIGESAFEGTTWYNNQPNGVVYINRVLYCYKGAMPKNTYVDIKEGTVSISDRAFRYCQNLTSVTIPSSVTTIGYGAFWYCPGLTLIDMGSSVTTIGEWAFYKCSGLTSIIIPSSVVSIGANAYYLCDGLESVTCQAVTPPEIQENTFFQYNANLYVPAGCIEAYQETEYWKNFTDIVEMPSGMESISDSDMCIYVANRTLHIENGEVPYRVYSVSGQLIYSGNDSAVRLSVPGIYVVQAGNSSQKVIVK